MATIQERMNVLQKHGMSRDAIAAILGVTPADVVAVDADPSSPVTTPGGGDLTVPVVLETTEAADPALQIGTEDATAPRVEVSGGGRVQWSADGIAQDIGIQPDPDYGPGSIGIYTSEEAGQTGIQLYSPGWEPDAPTPDGAPMVVALYAYPGSAGQVVYGQGDAQSASAEQGVFDDGAGKFHGRLKVTSQPGVAPTTAMLVVGDYTWPGVAVLADGTVVLTTLGTGGSVRTVKLVCDTEADALLLNSGRALKFTSPDGTTTETIAVNNDGQLIGSDGKRILVLPIEASTDPFIGTGFYTPIVATRMDGDEANRLEIRAGGQLAWGDGELWEGQASLDLDYSLPGQSRLIIPQNDGALSLAQVFLRPRPAPGPDVLGGLLAGVISWDGERLNLTTTNPLDGGEVFQWAIPAIADAGDDAGVLRSGSVAPVADPFTVRNAAGDIVMQIDGDGQVHMKTGMTIEYDL